MKRVKVLGWRYRLLVTTAVLIGFGMVFGLGWNSAARQYQGNTDNQTGSIYEIATISVSVPKLAPWMHSSPSSLGFARFPHHHAALAVSTLDCNQQACIALTFDDGPNNDSTPQILDALQRGHAASTFFLIGNRVAARSDIVRRIYRAGHDIGNHSWTHPSFAKLPPDQIEQQITQAQQAIAATGIPAPAFVRPPYGVVNQTVLDHVHLPLIQWNVDPRDWREKDPNAIANSVVAQAKPGAIILLHDRTETAAALDRVIASLSPHYRLVTVSQLLRLPPDAHGQYFSQFTHR